jgi:hypothetical protein
MNKSDTGLGLGLVAAAAICCCAKLLIFGLPALALATGQAVLIVAAVGAALALAGVVAWRHRFIPPPTLVARPGHPGGGVHDPGAPSPSG